MLLIKQIAGDTTKSASRRCNIIFRAYANGAQDKYKLLQQQRAKRPVSPHLTIYEPELTWYLSGLHRLTSLVLGTLFFSTTIYFGIAGILNMTHTNTESLTNKYRAMVGDRSRLAVAAAFSYTFALHLTLSMRMLSWDFGKLLSLRAIYRSGYLALGSAFALGTYLSSLSFN